MWYNDSVAIFFVLTVLVLPEEEATLFKLVSKEDTCKIVKKIIGELTVKYSYYEMSILLNVNEKTIYKWRSGYIPKADNFINLQILHKTLT